MRPYIIIGTGIAGITAAQAIREHDPRTPILLIGDEPQGFYSRPGLAYYLTGEVPHQQLYPITSQEFQDLKLKFLHQRVTGLNPDQGYVDLATGEKLAYRSLLLAIGARAALPTTPGVNLQGVVTFDTMDDTHQIIKLARRSRRGLVIGGGITALELVEGFTARGLATHYLLRGKRYWSNVLDEAESRIVEKRLENHGARLHYHTQVEEIIGRKGRVTGVRTNAGELISCEIIGIAIGTRPRLDLAKSAGLRTDRGILVDEYLRTNDENIYAAGDVAQVYDPLSGKALLDSLWDTARDQGWAAGKNMCGNPFEYRKAVPLNVARLAGLTTTIIGMVGSGKDDDLVTIARGDSETWRQMPDALVVQRNFDVSRLRLTIGDCTLLGAIVMGDQTLTRSLTKLIELQIDITSIRAQLISPDSDIVETILHLWEQSQVQHAAQRT